MGHGLVPARVESIVVQHQPVGWLGAQGVDGFARILLPGDTAPGGVRRVVSTKRGRRWFRLAQSFHRPCRVGQHLSRHRVDGPHHQTHLGAGLFQCFSQSETALEVPGADNGRSVNAKYDLHV